MPFTIIRLERTTSTMTEALGHPPGTVVVAEEQTAGQGRLGREWHSEKEAGLYLSAVLRLPCLAEQAPVITLALGLAVQEAIQNRAGLTCDLRWPNDVLVGERKCAGILVELHGDRVIAGVGVNVNHSGFPEELEAIATSLRNETGQEQSKEELLAAILDSIETYVGLLEAEGGTAILRLFARASSYVSGRRVTVDGVPGTTDGLDESGFLWLRTDRGERRLIRAGGVRPIG